jgi:hypothetical protein
MSSTASDPAGSQTIVLIHGMWGDAAQLGARVQPLQRLRPAQARACVAWARGQARTATPRPAVAPNLSITTSSTTTRPREIDTHRLDRPA